MTRIGIVAAEPSGDQLAGHLMAAIKRLDPQVTFEGIGGERMYQQGMKSWHPMEKLSVMGLVEVLKHLPELLKIRRQLVRRWTENPPDLFIGVDAPDFNLGLEKQLKAINVPTVQYVCPTIWAWRSGRIKTIKQAVELVLAIYPFEVPLLKKNNIRGFYAGNPLAQDLKTVPLQADAKSQLSIEQDKPVLGLLPGSRLSEVSRLSEDFINAARLLHNKIPELVILLPAATRKIGSYLSNLLADEKSLNIKILDGHSRQVMAAADVLLLASGTAALETMLYKKPMVVAYKVHWLTYFITVKLGLLKTAFVSLPNILSGKRLVPEYLQDECHPENLAGAALNYFNDEKARQSLQAEFEQMHQELSQGDIDQAAGAVVELIRP